jgi:hypothetical protein
MTALVILMGNFDSGVAATLGALPGWDASPLTVTSIFPEPLRQVTSLSPMRPSSRLNMRSCLPALSLQRKRAHQDVPV